MRVEFGFAKALGRESRFSLDDIHKAARARGDHRPRLKDGAIDWDKVEENFLIMFAMDNRQMPPSTVFTKERQQRALAYVQFWSDNPEGSLAAWKAQSRQPTYPMEMAMVAEAFANGGDDSALPFIKELRLLRPVEADAILARLLWRKGKVEEAYQALKAAIERSRTDPWFFDAFMVHALHMMPEMAKNDREMAK